MKIDKSDWISVEELDEKMPELIEQTLSTPGNVILRTPTASGKTHNLASWIANQNWDYQKVVICCPTHNLCKEWVSRLKDKGVEPVYIEGKEYSNMELLLMKMGEHGGKRADNKVKELEESESGVFIITHARFAILQQDDEPFTADYIIIDEDPLSALISQVAFTMKDVVDLTYTVQKFEPKPLIDIKMLNNVADGDSYPMREFFKPLAKVVKKNIKTYLRYSNGEVFSSLFNLPERMIKQGRYFYGVLPLPNLPNVKIFSATGKINTLKIIYPYEKISVIDYQKVRNTGKVIQLTENRGSATKKDTLMATIKQFFIDNNMLEESKKYPIFTFKGGIAGIKENGYSVPVIDDKEVHLMSCAGLDCFKGQNIIVAGKYDMGVIGYRTLALAGGVELPKSLTKSMHVYREGKEKCFLFDDPVARTLEIEYINDILVQAIGRARTLRTNANVFVFNDFITTSADYVY